MVSLRSEAKEQSQKATKSREIAVHASGQTSPMFYEQEKQIDA